MEEASLLTYPWKPQGTLTPHTIVQIYSEITRSELCSKRKYLHFKDHFFTSENLLCDSNVQIKHPVAPDHRTNDIIKPQPTTLAHIISHVKLIFFKHHEALLVQAGAQCLAQGHLSSTRRGRVRSSHLLALQFLTSVYFSVTSCPSFRWMTNIKEHREDK